MEIKKLLSFSLLKYLELAVSAISSLILAHKVGPQGMAAISPLLLYITYSGFFSLGGPSVYLKEKSKGEFSNRGKVLLNVLLAAIFTTLCYFIIFGWSYIFVPFISMAVFVRSYLIANFRIKDKIFVINIACISSALSTLLLVILLVNNVDEYIMSVFLGHVIAIIIYLNFDKSVLQRFIVTIKDKIDINDWHSFLKLGLKLNIVAFLTLFLMSTDRLIVLNLGLNSDAIGTFQLSDMIAGLFYLLITNVMFFFYPSWIRRIQRDSVFRNKYLKISCVLPFLLISLFPIAYFASCFIFPYLFPEFVDLSFYLMISMLMKTCVIGFSIQNVVYISNNSEGELIKRYVSMLVFYLLGVAINYFLYLKLDFLFEWFLIINAVFLLIIVSVYNYVCYKRINFKF